MAGPAGRAGDWRSRRRCRARLAAGFSAARTSWCPGRIACRRASRSPCCGDFRTCCRCSCDKATQRPSGNASWATALAAIGGSVGVPPAARRQPGGLPCGRRRRWAVGAAGVTSAVAATATARLWRLSATCVAPNSSTIQCRKWVGRLIGGASPSRACQSAPCCTASNSPGAARGVTYGENAADDAGLDRLRGRFPLWFFRMACRRAAGEPVADAKSRTARARFRGRMERPEVIIIGAALAVWRRRWACSAGVQARIYEQRRARAGRGRSRPVDQPERALGLKSPGVV